ncbi:MAG: hypothetical protein QF893_02370 [Alphaproteobacteria bacterium]|jgi:hypothetical protein|nr:hypothetical protein [Alphaproteobacteria bacterium]
MAQASEGGSVPQVARRPADDRPILSRIAIIGSTACGMAAAATPLMLWMAPTPTILYLTFLWGFVACIGVLGFMKYMPEHRHELAPVKASENAPQNAPPRP